jgi:hypothetical protein
MKSFKEFEAIAYKGAVPHTVFSGGKAKKIPKGKAVPVRSRSSAGGFGGVGGGSAPGPGGGAGGTSGASGNGGGNGGDGE